MDDCDPDDRSLDEPRSGWRRIVAAVPAAAAGLIPVGACPVCMTGVIGVLSSLGLGFMLETRYLFPIMAGLLGLALLALGYKAQARRGFGPLVVGATAAAAILTARFLVASEGLAYAGLAGLAVAALWNAWPKRNAVRERCADCEAPR